MHKKGMLFLTFLVLVILLGVSVAAETNHDHEHETEHEVKMVNGYGVELLTEPENPKTGKEAQLIAHIKNENTSVSNLHVEIQITKMEMHAEEMEEHIVLAFEEGNAHEEENEPGHYAYHHTFEEEGAYMIRVKIEGVGTTDAFHITVVGSFHKGELSLPLIFVAIGIGTAALMIVWTQKRRA